MITDLRHFHSSSMLIDQYFCLVSVDSRQAVPKGKLGPWAGDRLITIGDDMKECPEGMLTKAEEDEINEWVSQQKEGQTYFDFVEKKYHIGRIADEDTITAPDGQIVILRNLSKRVYVREQDLLRYQEDEGVKETWGFDQLILINTAWSNDSSCGLESDLIPGSWAGDRFDITVLKNIDPELWKDVTEQEAKNMAMNQGSLWSLFA
ncbi:hypothetical protein M378DRAFT_155074 [Amanita muscaria Koide BX008]|uniref:Uncharacterized protein n=1 Tax=Amanita muscaria (strain Koide BX008) TaxID=946122 RepID=A0A0C2T6A9_AMAMK|nr:hypothetical protein M378DRAFT_155074 [Amanita muscaria Koide BX008]